MRKHKTRRASIKSSATLGTKSVVLKEGEGKKVPAFTENEYLKWAIIRRRIQEQCKKKKKEPRNRCDYCRSEVLP